MRPVQRKQGCKRLLRGVRDEEVAGSNPVTPTVKVLVKYIGGGTSPLLHDQQSRCRSARPSWAKTVIRAARQLGLLSGRWLVDSHLNESRALVLGSNSCSIHKSGRF